MHAFTTFTAATALFTSLVSGRALATREEDCCLTVADASYLVNSFAILINTTFSTALAIDILTPDVQDYSDSINFLAGNPLGSVTFPSRAAYIAGQGSQPPIPFEVLSIDAVTCSTIAFRWMAFPGALAVKGIDIFYTVPSANGSVGFQISEVFAEFNVAAWTIDIGGTCAPPTRAAKLFKRS